MDKKKNNSHILCQIDYFYAKLYFYIDIIPTQMSCGSNNETVFIAELCVIITIEKKLNLTLKYIIIYIH